MSNYNPRTFTSLGLLRSIPAALLHRFFLPHQGFLQSLQFDWPDSPENLDYRALHATLMKPLASMPDKRLAQAMFVVDEMSDEAGVAALVDAIRETEPTFSRDRHMENVVFVMTRWLIDPELVENTNARRYARENRTFRSYRTSLNLPAGRLNAVELAAFQDQIATLLAPFYPPESVKVFQFPENDGSETLRFIVRHGGPLVREGIVKADAPGESDSCLFRREVFDVIVYDPQNNEVRIHAKKRDCDLYTHACGLQFLDKADAFPDTDKYTLEPLRTAREQSLVCADTRDKTLFVDMGLPVSLQYLYERHKVPSPAPSEALFKPAKPIAPLVPPASTPNTAKACACGCGTPIDAASESASSLAGRQAAAEAAFPQQLAQAEAAGDYLVWDAILDGRTTEVCLGRHGNRWGDGWFSPPPAHYNCRSSVIRVPKASYQPPK